MMTEQRWTHVALVWAKGMLKNSAVTLYINGKQIAVQKVNILFFLKKSLNRIFYL
jgi:hypothetical protein